MFASGGEPETSTAAFRVFGSAAAVGFPHVAPISVNAAQPPGVAESCTTRQQGN